MGRSTRFRPAAIQPLEERVVLSHAHAPSAAVIQGRIDGKVQQAFVRYEASYARAATTAPFLFEGRVQRGVEGLDVNLARTLGRLPHVDDTLLPAIDRELVGNGDSLLTKLSALQPSASGPGASAASRASVGTAAIDQARQQVLAQVNLFFGNPGYNFLNPPDATPAVQVAPAAPPTAAPAQSPANPAPQGGLVTAAAPPAPITTGTTPASPSPAPAAPVATPPAPPVVPTSTGTVTPTPAANPPAQAPAPAPSAPAPPSTPVIVPTGTAAPGTPPAPASPTPAPSGTAGGTTTPAAPTPAPAPAPAPTTPPTNGNGPGTPANPPTTSPIAPAGTTGAGTSGPAAGKGTPADGGAASPAPVVAPKPATGDGTGTPQGGPTPPPPAPGTGTGSGAKAPGDSKPPAKGGTGTADPGLNPAPPTPTGNGPVNPPAPAPAPTPAPEDPNFNTPHDLAITVLAQGSQLVTQVDEDAVFRDQPTWQRFWDAHVANTTYNDGTHPAAPQVDFSKQMVVVSIIYRPSSGYSLTLDHVKTDHGQVTVDTTEHRPGHDSTVHQGTTQPYVFAAVPREDGNVSFRHQVVTPDSA